MAREHLRASAAIRVTDVEARLVVAAEHLVHALEVGHRRNTRLAADLASTALAELDQLTGLSNRHYLQRFLGDQDAPADLLAMLIDVDELKTVNDTGGHDASDAVLTAVARVLRDQSGPGDVLIRWGGDEFLAPATPSWPLAAPRAAGPGRATRCSSAPYTPPPPMDYTVKCTRKGRAGIYA